MARMARLVVPGYPHHVTQRGNGRQETFFEKDDYHAYLELMAEWCGHCGVEIWAYCLMPNHVHLIGPEKGTQLFSADLGKAGRLGAWTGTHKPAPTAEDAADILPKPPEKSCVPSFSPFSQSGRLTVEQVKWTWNYKHGRMEGIRLPEELAEALREK